MRNALISNVTRKKSAHFVTLLVHSIGILISCVRYAFLVASIEPISRVNGKNKRTLDW